MIVSKKGGRRARERDEERDREGQRRKERKERAVPMTVSPPEECVGSLSCS